MGRRRTADHPMNFHIKGFIATSFSDWPGKVVSVLFLPSCNFRCPYCHNPELVLNPQALPDVPLAQVLEGLRRYRGWLDGVCLSGGEPTLQPWLPALIRRLRQEPGLGIKLDTNGLRPDILRDLIGGGLVDYVAMDLKGPLQAERYSSCAGVRLEEEEMARIEESIRILMGGEVEFEFRTTLVPSLLAEPEIYELARRVRGARRFTLQNFRPREVLDPALRDVSPFDEEALRRMQIRVDELIR